MGKEVLAYGQSLKRKNILPAVLKCQIKTWFKDFMSFLEVVCTFVNEEKSTIKIHGDGVSMVKGL